MTVEVSLDASPREVEVPAALAADADALARFDALAYTHRKELARWVSEAKEDDMLREGRTRS